MDRKIYQPTEKQEEKWNALTTVAMPTDDEFKATWKRQHHGKISGWGMGKRNWIVGNMKNCREYQLGLWQARLDIVAGLDYQNEAITDENANAYNLGYYRGFETTIEHMDPDMLVKLQSQLEA